MAKNVLGSELETCSNDPKTGFFRNGKCDTCGDDEGMHTVCVEVDSDFLEFSRRVGNDLSTPIPEYEFPGLKPGDRWCVCFGRWMEALHAGLAPKILLASTHMSVIEHVSMDVLIQHAIDPPEKTGTSDQNK